MSKHKPRLFEGAATALVTPFKDGAKTVADAMTKVAKQQPAPASQAPAAEVKKEMAPQV
jgi:hypothetical protein